MNQQDCILPDCYRDSQELHDTFWPDIERQLPALKDIIATHFECSCDDLRLLDGGAYARAYVTSLETGHKLVARVVLPVRKTLKTEAEVATMDCIRGEDKYIEQSKCPNSFSARTSIPVPRVHIFCSTQDNPVGAEWIVMDHLPGERLIDCWDDFTLEQRRCTAEDLASIMSTIYAITSTHCGSLLTDHSLRDSQSARRFGGPPSLPLGVESHTASGHFTVGPVNASAFMVLLYPPPIDRCGPFRFERAYLEAVAFANITETNELIVKHRSGAYEKLLEIYDSVYDLYEREVERVFGCSATLEPLFHLSHGDLSDTNVLVDKDTGRITGIIDWEIAGFRPSWLAAGTGGWLDYDSCDRLFYEDTWGKTEGNSTEEDELRNYFLAHITKRIPELAHHRTHGAELRAIHQVLGSLMPGNVIVWMTSYQNQWNTNERGPFPFDLESWSVADDEVWRR